MLFHLGDYNKNRLITNLGADVDGLEPSYSVGGNVKEAATSGNSVAAPQKVKQSDRMTQQFHLQVPNQRN